jgi:hypothetical protein
MGITFLMTSLVERDEVSGVTEGDAALPHKA